jgi:peptidoglycan/LPS O-acetylase OafA/YrhL
MTSPTKYRRPKPVSPTGRSAGTSVAGARRRYPLDSLRAIAAVSILGFHAYQNNRSDGSTYIWSGFAHELMLSSEAFVALFFVISGFLLYLPVVRAALDDRPQRPGRMMLLRRAARLIPLYLVIVLVVWSISNPNFGEAHWADLFTHLTFTQVYSNQYIFWTVGPAWSLAVEFHFYLLIALAIPLVGWWTARSDSRRKVLYGVLALPVAMTVAGIGWLVWAIHISPQPGDAWAVWFNPLAKAPIFAFGLLLAVAVAAGRRLKGRRIRLGLGAGALALFLGATLLRPILPGETEQWLGLLFGIAMALFMAVIVMNDESEMRWLTWKPLVAVGILSYSIYLLHEPLMRLARFAGILPDEGSGWGVAATFGIVLVLTILVARVSYPMIEQYGMRLLDMFGPDGRMRNYYNHSIDAPKLPRRLTMRVDWVHDGELPETRPTVNSRN